jgi:hypothetical protein
VFKINSNLFSNISQVCRIILLFSFDIIFFIFNRTINIINYRMEYKWINSRQWNSSFKSKRKIFMKLSNFFFFLDSITCRICCSCWYIFLFKISRYWWKSTWTISSSFRFTYDWSNTNESIPIKRGCLFKRRWEISFFYSLYASSMFLESGGTQPKQTTPVIRKRRNTQICSKFYYEEKSN